MSENMFNKARKALEGKGKALALTGVAAFGMGIGNQAEAGKGATNVPTPATINVPQAPKPESPVQTAEVPEDLAGYMKACVSNATFKDAIGSLYDSKTAAKIWEMTIRTLSDSSIKDKSVALLKAFDQFPGLANRIDTYRTMDTFDSSEYGKINPQLFRDCIVDNKGAKGDTGAAGRDGKDGLNGLDGKDGTNGRDGVDGKDGQNGQDAITTTVHEAATATQEIQPTAPEQATTATQEVVANTEAEVNVLESVHDCPLPPDGAQASYVFINKTTGVLNTFHVANNGTHWSGYPDDETKKVKGENIQDAQGKWIQEYPYIFMDGKVTLEWTKNSATGKQVLLPREVAGKIIKINYSSYQTWLQQMKKENKKVTVEEFMSWLKTAK